MVNTKAAKSPSTPKNQDLKSNNNNNTKEKTTSGKKLKQTRLPFATKAAAKEDSARKRKLSSPEEVRDVKIVRHAKEEEEDEPVIIEDEDEVEMVDIIPQEESNSAHPPSESDNLNVSLSEETTIDQLEVVPEQEEEDDDDEDDHDVIVADEDDERDEFNDSTTNAENHSSGNTSDPADTTADLLEPPANANGKPLTPRQLEKFLDKKKRHEERLKQRAEREKKLEDDRRQKEERQRQKEKDREEKEALKRKEKEEKEVQRVKEREEKERKKQVELEDKRKRDEQKKEEKRKREEFIEEERRKKEEEKRKRDIEDELKKKRASEAFTKFFKVGPKTAEEDAPNTAVSLKATEEVINSYFMPFEVKGDMKLAPLVRRSFTEEAKSSLEEQLKSTADPSLCYLQLLKAKKHIPLKGTKTYNSCDSSDSEDDLMVVDDELAHKVTEVKPKQKFRAKYLMFRENRRPAYYGTWQKKSSIVSPRTPFAKDEKYFEYDVDSDDEWEEEEPGESLHGSEDEKDKESEDDYEVDNDFFVPHGHLSDEEMQNADEEEDNSPEAQKVKLKLLQDEFNDEMKKKTEKIKPRLIGCIWVNAEGGKPDNCPDIFWELLQFRRVLSAGPIVLRAPVSDAEDAGMADAEDDEKPSNGRKGNSLPEDEIRDLISLVHGNLNRGKFLVQEFQAYREKLQPDPETRRVVTNMSILRRIKELAKWESGKWVVQKESLENYNLTDLPSINEWKYLLTPKRTHALKVEKKSTPALPTVANGQVSDPTITGSTVVDTVAPKTPSSKSQEKTSPPSAKQCKPNQNTISRFTKVLTTEEKQKQFQSINIASPKPSNPVPNENKAPHVEKLGTTPVTGSPGGVVIQPTITAPANGGVKKRVPLLMSVPRGQAISEQSKNLLIKNFLNKPSEKESAVVEGPPSAATKEDITIVLD